MTGKKSKNQKKKKYVILIDDDQAIVAALKKMFSEIEGLAGENTEKTDDNKKAKQADVCKKVVEFANFEVLRVTFVGDHYTFFIPKTDGQFNETGSYKEFVDYVRQAASLYDPKNILICVDVLLNDKSTDYRMGGNLLYSLKNENFLSNSHFAFMTRNYFVDNVVKKLERLSGNKIIPRPTTSMDGYRKNDFEILPNEGCNTPVKELRELHTTYWNFISNILEASLK